MKEKQKKMKWIAGYLAIAVSVLFMTLPVSAQSANDAIWSVSKLIDMLLTMVRLVGVGFGAFGIYQFATSMPSHDASQRGTGIVCIVAGIMMAFNKEILEMIGITI